MIAEFSAASSEGRVVNMITLRGAAVGDQT